jgi:putative transposase
VTGKQNNAKAKSTAEELKRLLAEDRDLLKTIVEETLQQALEAEMAEALQASKSERTSSRLGYRAGYYNRIPVTRMGHIELRVPQDRQGRFRTEVFERYQRSEKALVVAMLEMYVQGVSTSKVKTISEELCGHEFSASTISGMVQKLDEELERFAQRRLEEPYPYLILDARYEKASRESLSSWKELLAGLRQRSLQGVEFVVSDNHAGLRGAVQEALPEAVWQRCYVHFLRNALDYPPRKADDDCLRELRWIYDRRDAQEARQDLTAWMMKWGKRYAKLCRWVEENIEETLSFYRLPRQHHKNLKSTNMLARLREEIKRRTLVVRIFPNAAAGLRLVRALASRLMKTGLRLCSI